MAKKRRKILATLLSFLVITVIIVHIAAPFAVRYVANDVLKTYGADKVDIGYVNLNLLLGTVSVGDVHFWSGGEQTLFLRRVHMDMDLLDLLSQRISIRSFFVGRLDVTLAQGEQGLMLPGIVLPESSEPETPLETSEPSAWQFGIHEASILQSGVTMRLEQGDVTLYLNDFDLTDLLSWEDDTPAEIYAAMAVNNQRLLLEAQAFPFKQEKQINANLSSHGFSLEAFSGLARAASLEQLQGRLDMGQTIQVRMLPATTQVQVRGEISLQDLSVQTTDVILAQKRFGWEGQWEVNLQEENLDVQGDGTFTGSDASVEVAPYQLAFRDMSLSVLPRFRQDPEMHYGGSLEFRLDGLQVRDVSQNLSWLQVATLGLQKVDVSEEGIINAGRIFAEQVAVADLGGDDKPPLITAANVEVQKFHMPNFKRAEIDYAAINGLKGKIARRSDGSILLATGEPAPTASTETVEKEKTEKETGDREEPFTFAVYKFELGGDSQVAFSDKSVRPNFKTNIHDIKVVVANIDSAKPKQPVDVDVSLKIDDYSQFTLKGGLTPFADKLSANMQGEIQELNLTPLSSYAGEPLGYDFKRGQLDAKMDVNIKNDQLDVNNKLNIRKLNLAARENAESSSISDSLAMPLDKTLDLLRDDQGNIQLDLPVSGDLSKPDFNIDDALNKASTKALKFAAVYYLKNALQPWGTLLTVADLAGKAMEPRFENVLFQAGKAEPIQKQYEYMAKLATMLKERPGITLTICGLSTDSDRQAIGKEKGVAKEKVEKEVLLALANRRTQKVKEVFVNTHGVDPKRIFLCQPKLELEDEAAEPGVTISL